MHHHRIAAALAVVPLTFSLALAGCGAEEERPFAPRLAAGGAPNLLRGGSGQAPTDAAALPDLAPGESFLILDADGAASRAIRPTQHHFDGACTNLYVSGDLGEEFGDSPAVDPDDAPAEEPSMFPTDDLQVYLHLMPPLREQPTDGSVVEHVYAQDTSGTFIQLSDFTTATTVQLARAIVTVGAQTGSGRLVTVEGVTEDGVQVHAGYRPLSADAQ